MPVFLYTDIEGSTQLWEHHRDVMGAVLDRHDELLMECVGHFGGRHVKNTGDGMMVVFPEGDGRPLDCAMAMQLKLAAEQWPSITELRVRMALHAGPAEKRAGDYFGPVVNRLARLLSTAWGGQIILTPDVTQTIPLPEGATLTDLGIHVLKDLSDPQQVYGLVHADLPIREFPALRSMSSQPNNLPRQATPLVGRTKELAQIANFLSKPECRLLTLVAPGGMGKTRLGLQAAAEQIDSFRHGVFFVPLSGVDSIENIPLSIASALNLSFYGSEDVESQLHNYLREKQLLLLLDNFEQLIDGVDYISDLLAAAPEVKILVTSRRHLRLQIEWSFEVRGLPIAEKGQANLEEQDDSVDLFLQSAQRISPGFRPTKRDLQQIRRVCKLVDGMPLAIELAAAWVRTLSYREIADEIERDLDMLATEMHDVPWRQRSVRAIFEHSWLGLSPAERSVFAKLSVFRGGFSREAAQEVAGANIRKISELIDASLLTRNSSGKYQIHELLRQYASAKLAKNEESFRATHHRHAKYFISFLMDLEDSFIGGARVEPVTEITQELDNVAQAWQWAVDHKDLKLVGDGMRSLFWYYEARAWYSEGEDLLKSAADAFEGVTQHDSTKAKLILINLRVRQAWFSTRMYRFQNALQIDDLEMKAAGDLLLKAADLEGHWVAAGIVVNTHYGMGDYAAASKFLEHHDDRLERRHRYSQTWPWAKGHNVANLGRIAGALGDYAKARQLLQEGVNILRPLGDHVGIMLYIHTLGGVIHKLGSANEATALIQEGLSLAERHGNRMGKILAHGDLGDLAYAEGKYEEAQAHFETSRALSEEIGDRRGQALALTNLGRVAAVSGENELAKQLFENGLAITEGTGNRRGAALTMNRLSSVHLLLGNLQRAHTLCQRSWEICQEIGYQRGSIQALLSCGAVAIAQGNSREATRYFQESLTASQRVGYVSGVVRSHIGLGKIALDEGQLEEAKRYVSDGLALGGRSINKRVALSALLTLAKTLIRLEQINRGIELMALVREHPAADQEGREQASAALNSLAQQINPARFERMALRGKALTLEEVLADYCQTN